jgi:hypothetical protein
MLLLVLALPLYSLEDERRYRLPPGRGSQRPDAQPLLV